MIRTEGDNTLLDVKAVPGASRDQIAGPLGDRLKIRVSAPPEDGKANRAICTLIAVALDMKPSSIEIAHGHGSPNKTLRIPGLDADTVAERLGVR